MNWMTIIWPMVAGACVTLALINLRVALGDARRAPHIFFFFSSLAVAVVSGWELALLREHDLARYQVMLRWAVIPIWVMVASCAGFVWTLFGTGRKWLAITAVVLNGLAQLANLLSSVPAVRQAVALRQVQTFGGVTFSVPTIVNGPWNLAELASILALLVFVADASVQLWNQGGRRRAVVVGGSIFLFLILSRGHAILVEQGLLHTPYLVSFAFLGVILAMGHELGDEVFRAARLAHELSESERRMELAAQAASLGFWRWDLKGNQIWATSSAREMFGIPADQPLDFPYFLGHVHPDDREGLQQAVNRSLTDATDYEAEYRVLLPDGRIRWIAARGRPELRPDKNTAFMRGVVLDITERRRSESELQELRHQLSHAGRLSVMGQLAASLAHELNQPLGAILRNAEAAELFLNQNPPAFDELREILSDIRKDDQRAGAVIDSLRVLLKRQEVTRQALDLRHLIDEVVALARSDAVGRRISITTDLVSDLPHVWGNRVHLQQVLLNLLLNAMDAVNDVAIELRTVVVQARCHDALVEVAVVDRGVGIPVDRLSHLFEPFVTTKPEGMGLGLSISRTIIQAHGGQISAQNNPTGGATFRFSVPVASPDSP
jgi:two-component system, LuxR family, sensor kinase FixL